MYDKTLIGLNTKTDHFSVTNPRFIFLLFSLFFFQRTRFQFIPITPTPTLTLIHPSSARHHTNLHNQPTQSHSFTTMGACCGKPDRKNEGYVLGGSNASSNASAAPQPGIEAGKAKPINTTATASTSGGGHTLGSSPSSAPQGELSASALAAQKRAEAVITA